MEMSDSEDVFKSVFKKLKRRDPPADYNEVIDFNKATSTSNTSVSLDNPDSSTNAHCGVCDGLGLKQHRLWKICCMDEVPGFKFILNPFTAAGQRLWIKQCIENYPLPPNVTNVGDTTNLWKSYCNNKTKNNLGFWKLRWATLGYHHNWDTKEYSESHQSLFPSCLTKLSQHTAISLGFNLNPQAAIVNYYHLDSTLSGHTDHSEPNHDVPLISFSFGRKAIFMIGGREKCTYPTSVYVRSGDVIIMSQESRLSYHAVPKIFCKTNNEDDPWNVGNFSDGSWECYESYLKESRINVNVRQVF